jgi:hypothetical protein
MMKAINFRCISISAFRNSIQQIFDEVCPVDPLMMTFEFKGRHRILEKNEIVVMADPKAGRKMDVGSYLWLTVVIAAF